MKSKINNLVLSFFVALIACGALTSCGEDAENYDNKAFTTSEKVSSILLMGTNDTESRTIQTSIAKLEGSDVVVTYKVDESLVSQYNMAYADNAIILPSEYYELTVAVSTIAVGTVKGNDVEISFKNLSGLDRDLVYVLPITVANSNIEFLNSTRSTYFVIRGAALINTVADITTNYLSLQSPGTSSLKNMGEVSIEALLYIDKFGKLISTVMGIEGNFLFRIGDAGLPDNQLQLATSNGNVTDAAWQLPTGVWVHLAATYNSADGAVNVYFNGIKKGDTKTTSYRNNVNWATSSFYVGKSYDDNRYLSGSISECRVWNRVLTQDEIQGKDHFYVVAPDSPGLVAYWKFNEGGGQIIADHTGNENTIVANKTITWNPVSLPN
ncbi:hypothetical protein M2451_002320 [Dysgonomonas sp. PFB1-18]|uniref:DUF1735 and LamG domain-containing protein n=1 Tax=unclassified Dysgonomonas TaxID=2630389 RepID=UPI0024760EB6|nr:MULTISPECIES: DUF1735 and LamG domain-containing protein [unclassified Dysgonomonas]MDH6307086.1 hypothetical protein [Dysgonomonas sp. PF1-14]MDH6337005.1 hypothetical protein [Dysgonomonas sp. PF1-16]MDH6380991.1 hypothetical protein [Dysgonomonas sp. PFB1-18]MDH6396430.1 hypothetical protein [Dysgonomonas sp. PF1-23]